jgi:clan AA aspartic protease (TIGR02281 family)
MHNFRKNILLTLLFSLAFGGCAALDVAGEAVGVVGKVAWGGAKAVGGAVYTGTSMAGQTANQANKTAMRSSPAASDPLKTTMSKDRVVVPLIQEGKSYLVRLKLNDKVWGKFLVDTGASAMHISQAMAQKLKAKPERGQMVPVQLAGGRMVAGRVVVLKKVQIGEALVENAKAIVLDQDNMGLRDGLLGMTFLENFVFSLDTKKGELILERRR